MNRPFHPFFAPAALFLAALLAAGCPQAEETPGPGDLADEDLERPRDLSRDPADEPVVDPEQEPAVDLVEDLPSDPVRDPGLEPIYDLPGDQPADETADPAADLPADQTTDPTTDPTPDTTPDSQPDTGPVCPNFNLGSMVGSAVATGTTVGRGDDNTSGICAMGSIGSEDVTLLWTAPVAGNYRFDTLGSGYDTILYLLDGGCSGAELACNDDETEGESLQSSLVVPLAANQSVVVVIDGYGGAAGSYQLNIGEQTGCLADYDLGSGYGSPIAIGYLSTQGDDTLGSCAYDYGGQDVSFTWTAPTSALFRFTTEGSEFDTVLYLYGSDCTTELACNDDIWGDLGTLSLIELNLSIGEQVVVVVDAYLSSSTGIYELSIYNISSPEVVCDDWADDDADGLTDCADPSTCQGTADCTPGTGPSGAACDRHADCNATGADPSCFVEGMGWPVGYCAEYCDPDADDCPDGSICVLFVGDVGYCMDRCDGSYGGCRSDTMPDYWDPEGGTISYVCDDFDIWTDGTLVCGPTWWLE
ncbi:MAG: hypothetical protein JW797_17170 [Bradymonadales bacterium]|nr:hypothetical protein [Bradymonadales bacterium]